jgi:hypothetical protein
MFGSRMKCTCPCGRASKGLMLKIVNFLGAFL